MPHSKDHIRKGERGSVFVYIFIGIILFAALAFTFSRSFQSSDTAITPQKARLAGADILTYSNKVAQAVQKLIARGCSEKELNFFNPVVAGYTNASAPSDKRCNIFDPAGGKLTWMAPPTGSNNGTTWIITSNRVGTADGTTNLGSSSYDLTLLLPGVKEDVCTQINRALNNASTSWESSGVHAISLFTGTFGTGTDSINRANLTPVYASGCFCDATPCTASNRYFYKAILVR